MKCFVITRTSLITEVFRVEAETEDTALETLTTDEEDSSVEQLEHSTHHSNIDQIEEI